MLIYVASSWQNDGPVIDEVHKTLRDAGYETFDFRKSIGAEGNKWWIGLDDLGDPLSNLTRPERKRVFEYDFDGLQRADAVVAVLPAGVDTHMEIAWAVGVGKPVVIYGEPRDNTYHLMTLMCKNIVAPGERPEVILEALDQAIKASGLTNVCVEAKELFRRIRPISTMEEE